MQARQAAGRVELGHQQGGRGQLGPAPPAQREQQRRDEQERQQQAGAGAEQGRVERRQPLPGHEPERAGRALPGADGGDGRPGPQPERQRGEQQQEAEAAGAAPDGRRSGGAIGAPCSSARRAACSSGR